MARRGCASAISWSIDVYRNTEISDIQYTASVDPECSAGLPHAPGEGFSVQQPEHTGRSPASVCKPEFRIDTDWAVIKALGTRFWVHYDEDREITWVVVKEGEVSVTGAGVEVIVPAGYQTWVEPNKAPQEPIPACRDLIGDLFPLIDELTNQDRQDLELLCRGQEARQPGTAQQITPTVQARIATPTATRRPPPITDSVRRHSRSYSPSHSSSPGCVSGDPVERSKRWCGLHGVQSGRDSGVASRSPAGAG